MSAITFGQQDIVATLTPERPRPGAKPVQVRVYARFGRVRERLVAEICDAVGGEAVYFEFKSPARRYLLPVISWKRPDYAGKGSSSGWLVHAADMLKAAADGPEWTVTAFGSARVRWTVAFSMVRNSAARDALDMEPDSAGSPEAAGPRQDGSMREEF